MGKVCTRISQDAVPIEQYMEKRAESGIFQASVSSANQSITITAACLLKCGPVSMQRPVVDIAAPVERPIANSITREFYEDVQS